MKTPTQRADRAPRGVLAGEQCGQRLSLTGQFFTSINEKSYLVSIHCE